jgi:hypothetical protein
VVSVEEAAVLAASVAVVLVVVALAVAGRTTSIPNFKA